LNRELKIIMMKLFGKGILLLVSTLLIFGCKKKESEQTEVLTQTGILGKWKLEMRSIDGIAGLAVECCDYLEFTEDNVVNDWIGVFEANGVGYETNGIFEIDAAGSTIKFNYEDSQKVYEYQIEEGDITFTYMDNNQSIVEHWRKQD
jgi:hypothetical protein